MSDWDHRQLCADGSCTGLIGSDGTCKVCGRAAPNWGDERKRGMVEDLDDEDEEDEDAAAAAGDDLDDDDDDDDDDEDEDADEDAEDDEDADDDAPEDQGPIAIVSRGPDPEAEQAWSKRTLCPDGACVGVIGKNGTCNVCGSRA